MPDPEQPPQREQAPPDRLGPIGSPHRRRLDLHQPSSGLPADPTVDVDPTPIDRPLLPGDLDPPTLPGPTPTGPMSQSVRVRHSHLVSSRRYASEHSGRGSGEVRRKSVELTIDGGQTDRRRRPTEVAKAGARTGATVCLPAMAADLTPCVFCGTPRPLDVPRCPTCKRGWIDSHVDRRPTPDRHRSTQRMSPRRRRRSPWRPPPSQPSPRLPPSLRHPSKTTTGKPEEPATVTPMPPKCRHRRLRLPRRRLPAATVPRLPRSLRRRTRGRGQGRPGNSRRTGDGVPRCHRGVAGSPRGGCR